MKAILRLRLQRKIDKLQAQMLEMGDRVVANLLLAMDALKNQDPRLAQRVFAAEDQINELEVDIEEGCLEAIALHQPVATDLRVIISILKANQDLERIGDLSVTIAHMATELSVRGHTTISGDYFLMAEKIRHMLIQVRQAFVEGSADIAYQVLADDDEVNSYRDKLQREFEQTYQQGEDRNPGNIYLFLTSRSLERIADQATNIAEDIIYMLTGEVVRHGNVPGTRLQDD